MNKILLMGIDIGTTATKVIVIDTDGHIVASTQRPSNLITERACWAEEDPCVWWSNVCTCIQDLCKNDNVKPEEIHAIGVSGMVPTLILLDEKGEVIRNSIQQNDARSSIEIDYFKKEINEEEVFQQTGSAITQQSIGPKLLWLKKNEYNSFSRAKSLLGSYDYINFKLTGTLAVEKNWALESGLYDLTTKDWIPKIVHLAGIDKDLLLPIKDSSEIVGTISKEASLLTGLLEGTPVIAGSADHISSAFSAGIKNPGDLLVKLGGAGDILLSLNDLKLNKKLFMDYHLIPNQYLINGCMASSGSLIKWFQTQFANDLTYKELDELAAEIPAGSDGLYLLPYFLGEKTPIFDPYARGVFWGLSLQHTRAHLFHAILEGISYGFLHHVKILEGMGQVISKVRVTNGGAKSFLWKQITADVLGFPLEIVDGHPGSSLGVAFLAGKSIGAFASWDDVDRFINIKATINPCLENREIYENNFEFYKEIYNSNKELFHRVNKEIE